MFICEQNANPEKTLSDRRQRNKKHKIEGKEAKAGGESETLFECHNFLVSSLCQLGSNIVPHNINKDTMYICIHTS